MRSSVFVRLCCAIVGACLCLPVLAQAPLPGTGPDEGKTVVYRDTWGIPHIYAPTAEAGLFAMGWTQAEDRPEELLKNLLRGIGESARFDGGGGVQGDTLALMWDHYGAAQRGLDTLEPETRAHLEAYVAGINAFYAAHPEDVPPWWGDRKADAAMVIAFGRLFLYSWSIDDGFGDLKRAGVEPGFKRARRGSNQFAISPQRSASGEAILYIDPHLSWYGPSRFWECRIHAGDLEGSGFNLAGTPYIGLGHNANVAWAMTTGAPDTADVYELTLNPDNPLQYKYDDGWKEITTREVEIVVGEMKDGVLVENVVKVPLYDCHYGPVVAMDGDKAYALKTAYADVVRGNEAWHHLNFAKDYTGAVAAMATGTMFPQNVMVADTSGNIYYQRTGRVPVRPEGYDWDRPVDGSTSATEWQGYHDTKDHVQALNPEQGYMQNCNNPPDAMLLNSPMTPDKYPDYIFGDLGYGPRGGWTTPRGARAVELLQGDDSVTVEEALDYALDVHPYGVEHWVEILREAHTSLGDRFSDNVDYQAGMADILAWNLEERRYSTGALKYYYWRKQLVADYGEDIMSDVVSQVDQFFKVATGEPYKKVSLGYDEESAALDSFVNAMAALRKDFGTLDVPWGEVFRVGRDGDSWPVGGGGDGNYGTITLRNVKYSGADENHQRMGRAGQTSTQIVVLSKPIQSWTQPPIGQSDRPDSEHFDDQAEKLFSKRTMKPTWWLPEDLAQHIVSRTELPYASADEGATSGKSVAAVIETWKQALEGAQLEEIISCYAEDFRGTDGANRDALHAFLSEAISNSALDDLRISYDPADIKEEEGKARLDSIELEGYFGSIWVDLVLEQRDGAWKIVKSHTST